MEQKQVKIHGIKFNKPFGPVQITELVFDEKDRVYKIKGAAGKGKTALVDGVRTGVQGSKVLTDNNKYGTDPIDIEIPLTDDGYKFYVGVKKGKPNIAGKSTVRHVLYTKDENGKKNSKIQIDGVEVSPAEYLGSFQTALTWRMDEVTSENPIVQKQILKSLYQKELKLQGVVFDKKSAAYNGTILHKIDLAIEDRTFKHMTRSQKGGNSEDLKEQHGIDTNRPETFPEAIDIEEINKKIRTFEREIIQKETDSEGTRNNQLSEIRNEASKLIIESLNYNTGLKIVYDAKTKELRSKYDAAEKLYTDYVADYEKDNELRSTCIELITKLSSRKLINSNQCLDMCKTLEDEYIARKPVTKPTLKDYEIPSPNYIPFSSDGQKVITSRSKNNTDEENQEITTQLENLEPDAKLIVNNVHQKKVDYSIKNKEEKKFNPKELNDKIEALNQDKVLAGKNNQKVEAVQSFLKWQLADGLVKKLNAEYVKLLANVDTGVKGLHITPEGSDIFLMYDGSYNTDYFGNPKKELRKVSAYSTSQRPIICMMMQHHALKDMPKVMRYIFIDNIPIDNATKAMIEKMSIELDLHVFLNMTGDFDKDTLKDGEILIENGGVFFK